jgi:hypothetical protein
VLLRIATAFMEQLRLGDDLAFLFEFDLVYNSSKRGGSLFVGYASSPFGYRLTYAAAAVGISSARGTGGLADSELPSWRELRRPTMFGQERGYRTMRGLLSLLATLGCDSW